MKKLIILAACFAGLAAFVYYYEIVGKEARDQAEELEQSVLKIEQEAVRSVEIERTGESPVHLEKAEDSWMLRRPVDALADQNTVDSLLTNLTTAKRDRVLEAVSDADLRTYGLEDPRITIRVGTEGGEQILQVGEKDFSGNKLYVRLDGSADVIVTGTTLETAVNKPVADWRSKDALKFGRAKVEEIEIQRSSGTVKLSKRDGVWKLDSPLEDAADETKVSGLLSTLEFAKAVEFVAEDPEDLAEYGLSEPAVSVRLRESGSETWHRLDLGQAEGENYFARSSLRNSVFTLKTEVFDDLTQDVQAFRERDVLDVKQDQVSKLEIRRGEEVLVVRREDFTWTVEAPPAQEGKEALAYKFWYPIDDMEFEEIQPDVAKPEQADVQVTVTLADGTTRDFWFWKSGDTCLALRVGSGTGGTIKAEDFEKLQFKVEDIVDTQAETPGA